MSENGIRQRLKAQETVFGTAIQQVGSPELPRVFAAAGADFVWLDAEHGPFDLETMQALVRSATLCGLAPLVRVGELLYSLVARALDAGAQGVIFPRVEDPGLLREAISWTKFPPIGRRGFGLGAPQLDYRRVSFTDAIQNANDNTLVVVQFETAKAIERADELLSVPGVDVALIGPADLSVSLGVPGEFDHPSMNGAISSLIAACERYSVAPGIHTRTAKLASGWLEKGMRFVSSGNEVGLLLERATDLFSGLRTTADLRSQNARKTGASAQI
jgi:2-dehydro-3-deoxyglucarate aldolase/4-hydroxy-2-oxoheptanedioate aldolase